MILKDRVTVFRLLPSDTDPYGTAVARMDINNVMVFEKRSVGAEFRDEGRCVVYCFPHRSSVSGGKLSDIALGDLVVVGACRGSFDPVTDELGLCRRIVSVEERSCGSAGMHHLVIEAV